MIDVTASSVVLPYVCSICDEKDASFLTDLEENGGWGDEGCDCDNCVKYEDMAPAVPAPAPVISREAKATPRNDVHLSILAGKVLTALADLAADSTAWSERLRAELESGMEYCRAVSASRPPVAVVGPVDLEQAVRRLATDESQQPARALIPDCRDVEVLLRDLLAQSRRPEPAELRAAIKFFVREVGYLGS
jgi:hypothetical protein